MHSVCSGPGFGGRTQTLPFSTANAEQTQKLPVSIGDVHLLICQELFSVNSEKLLKSKTKSNLAIHKNHYVHLHFTPHISANTSHPVSPPPLK